MKKITVTVFLVVLFLFFTLFSCKPPSQVEEAKEETFGAAPVKEKKVAWPPFFLCLMSYTLKTLQFSRTYSILKERRYV